MEQQLEEWINTYSADLYQWAFRKVSNSELAKDLVQDTFMAVAEKPEKFKGESSPKTWLFSILNHKIIDYYRKKVKEPVRMENHVFSNFFDEAGSWKKEHMPERWDNEQGHMLDDTEFRQILMQCLDALPEKWNLCVQLKYLSEKKGEEICQEIGITPTNLWQIIHRAKLQLRNCIEINWINT